MRRMLPEYSSDEQGTKTFAAETRMTRRGRGEELTSFRALRASARAASTTAARARAVTLVCLLALACCTAAGAQTGARQRVAGESQSSAEAPLTNAAVVRLVRAKFSEKTIIAIVRTRPARFDLSPDRLIELKKGGVPERVILAMLARDEAGALASAAADDDDFDSDPFFAGLNNPGRGQTGGGVEPGETNIFGSSGGARGRTRTNGVGGGAEGETQTTGTASVRIIRPPAEAGGAPPQMERTPTLTNDSVAELVAAGFSEGTIIRRIEGSPADFDLSPAKLADLRRRRVTEPVINAMRAAMGGDAPAPSNTPENR